MVSILFANPELLFTLLTFPVCAGLILFAFFRRRHALRQLGNALLLRKSLLVRPNVRRWKTLLTLSALSLLAIACAGPQWGIDKDAQHRKGRDIFVVFDLSRSMLAEQPSRRSLAVKSMAKLADALEAHGGHRLALVGFASKARLFFPLTQDYDHFRHVLTQIDAGDYPSLSVEDPASGTRIGAALSLAASLADPQRTNRPVMLLLSDGDDPADDEEWPEGVLAARTKQIRVHTVGFGDPKDAQTIPLGRDVFLFDGKPILSKLNEERLQEIARQTDGRYLKAHTNALDLGVFVPHLLDIDELREGEPIENAVPVYQLRYAWPLLPAAFLFMLTFALNEGPLPRKETPIMNTAPPRDRTRSKGMALSFMVLAVLSMSAAGPQDADTLLRLGNDAFAAQKYDGALAYYEQAEAQTLDPGLVSFNKAAALFRLQRFKEAIECYRRAVDDDRAPSDRKARMYFDLGNALAQHAGERAAPLAEAVANYRKCLHQADLPPKLREDARHNLELAQLRWLKAKQQEPSEPKPPDSPPKNNSLDTKDPKESDKTHYKPIEPGGKKKRDGADDVPKGGKSKKLDFDSHITVLPDDVNLQAISREDALMTLDEHARRIAEDRRKLRNPAGPAALSTKDW